jgi:prevent-host-death family protein
MARSAEQNPRSKGCRNRSEERIMKHVSVADAKARLSELIQQLAEEEEIVIVRHGHPVARLLTVPRIRLDDHSISMPMPLSHETMSAELDDIDSGPITLR